MTRANLRPKRAASPPALPGSETVAELYDRSLGMLATLRQRGLADAADQRPTRFSITRTAELVGRTPTAIREAEKDGPHRNRASSGLHPG